MNDMSEIDKNNSSENEFKTTDKYLSFYCGEFNYAMKIDYIMEIIVKHNVTPLPKLPMFARGIMNLRGQIIPIVDMRLLINKDKSIQNKDSCIIVTEINQILLGILIDGVNQVFDFNTNEIKPHTSPKDEFIVGIATIEGINHLFLSPEQMVNEQNTPI